MASVAICPHCYLQLIVPNGVERDALVECPTCAKEFDLGQAVLREIPEVVRVERARVAESEAKQVAAEVEAEIKADVIKEIQAKIEAEIAANGLHTGVREVLSLESPEAEGKRLADTVRRPDAEISAWFRQNETVPELPPVAVADVEVDVEAEITETRAAADVAEVAEVIEIDRIVERIEEEAKVTPEPVESRPTAVTLADLLPPRGQSEEPLPGPSFDLPNVPLTPDNGATIEIDPSMSFGPAAETEFELDDVDFESLPAGDVAAAEDAVYSEPNFREPVLASQAEEPFAMPTLPRTRKKPSVVRGFVKIALGGVVGLSLGYFLLLYLLGPPGDIFQLAQYMPSAVLPTALQPTPTNVAEATEAPTQPLNATAEEPVKEIANEETESKNVPAGYVEEANSAPAPPANDAASEDDRYGRTPSPLEEPAAAPIASISPLPLSGPTYTIEQLTAALDASEQAKSGLVTGDLSDAAVRRTKGMSYAKLCDLAHALVFRDRSAPSDQSAELKQRADHLFGEVLSDARVRDEVNRIAAIWIDSPHRSHGGVFLAGKLSGGQIAGDVYEYQLATANGGTLALVMQEPLDPLVDGSNHPLGIVGTIVDKPVEQITGYHGTAPRAIWVESAIPLE